ncbi:hypothetical protein ABVT39_014278, partial [Epinephelus coioides]
PHTGVCSLALHVDTDHCSRLHISTLYEVCAQHNASLRRRQKRSSGRLVNLKEVTDSVQLKAARLHLHPEFVTAFWNVVQKRNGGRLWVWNIMYDGIP